MTVLFTLFSFIAMVAVAGFFAGFLRVPPALAPLLSVCSSIIWFTAFGMFGLLHLGAWFYYAFAVGALLALILRKAYTKCLHWAFGLFVVAGLLLVALFAYKQPLCNQWDEFSFWGTAVKLTKINGVLYPQAEIGWPWVASQKPGIVLLGWFFNFFGDFADWRMMIGVNMAALAGICAVSGAGGKNKQWYTGVLVAMIAFLAPYICTIFRPLTTPSNVYMNVQGDDTMVWLFVGALVLFYVLREKNLPLWGASIALGALILTKDTALPLALIAAVLMCVDILFVGKQASFLQLRGKLAKWCHCAVLLVVPVVVFFSWVLYLKLAINVNAVGDIGGTQSIGMVEMLISGVMQLFGIGTTQKFATLMGLMASNFFTIKLSLFGNGFMFVCVVWGITALAAFFTKQPAHRKRCILFGVFNTLGFIAYYIFIGFSYVFVFKDIESATLIGYERYIYPYYISWLLVSLALLGITASQTIQRFYGFAHLALLSILGISILRVGTFVSPDMSFIGYHDGYLYPRKTVIAQSKQVANIVQDKNERIFYIKQGDDGSGWFMTACELLPLQLDYSFGGGTFGLPEMFSEEIIYTIPLSAQELTQYIVENNCTYVYVAQSNDMLVQSYGHLFNDNLTACSENGAVYRVQQTANEVTFALVQEVYA